MSKYFKGVLALIIYPLLLMLSGCNSENAFSDSKEPPVPEVKLVRIDIFASPIKTRGVSELVIAKGNQLPFEAVGHYSDGTSQSFRDLSVLDWNSSNLEVGIFNEFIELTGVGVGRTSVTATKDGVISNTVDVSVTDAVITSIQVTPSSLELAKGQTQQLIATAIFSDATSTDVSDSVTWIPADTATAIVSSVGLLSAVDVGRTTLTATKDGVISNTVDVSVTDAVITSIQVTPSPVALAKGQTQQLMAIAIFSDATSTDVSDSVTWIPADTATAIVSSVGLLSAVDVGRTTLTATKDGVSSNTVDVSVTDAVITSIQVTPSPVALAKGQIQQLIATAIFSDGTSSDVSDSVTWIPVDTATAIVSSVGLLSAVDVGRTTLTATKDGVSSNTVAVSVTDAVITSIQVTPSPVTLAKGQTQQLMAIAIFSDATSTDVSDSVTWASVDTATATVSSVGLLSAVEVGRTSVTATKDGVISNTVDVSVTDAVITSIQVTPSPVELAKGQTQQLMAIATFSDGTSVDVSDSVTWIPADTATAIVSSVGLLSAVDVGRTTLTATKDGVISNTVDVSVTDAVITSIQVTPSPVALAKGQTQQLMAIAIFSDATSTDVSDSVTWASVDTATATVSSVGLLSAVDVGSTTLTATKDGVISNTVDVSVTDAVITSIQVTPSPVELAKGQTQQLMAIATFSDGTSVEVSDSVTWIPADTATAIVSSVGLLSAVDVGSTTLTATKDGVTSNTVSVNVCSLAGICIDAFDTGNGKLFTNSPSVAFLDSIGGSSTSGITVEVNDFGGLSNEFYTFNMNNINELCDTYNTQGIAERSNWRPATRDELKIELVNVYGDMFTERGWPVNVYYLSANSIRVDLRQGFEAPASTEIPTYVSCVSDP